MKSLVVHSVRIASAEIPAGQVAPISTDDVASVLRRLPIEDLAGLHSVVLTPMTKKDREANGRYRRKPRPTIQLFSYPDTFVFEFKSKVAKGVISQQLADEIEYGMVVEATERGYRCVWEPDDLRRFMLEVVLLHEVGHHVRAERLTRSGRTYEAMSSQQSELEAQTYARRTRALIQEAR